ncbi:hypothetical protein HRI_000667400 [Hibiscus trionum]|uniref:Uncharacterized protein n=1 Tax=Hibiscus trionum TaxID=183268 RepID=A0A9W7LN45_HIBTR|nr:hypothetical protein HRI_000667400 [Hibiscus trionum]
MTNPSDVTAVPANTVETRSDKAKRASSRDAISSLQDIVTQLETSSKESTKRADHVDDRLKELENRGDHRKEDFQKLFDEAVENLELQNGSLKAELIDLKEVVSVLKSELSIYKSAVTNGVIASPSSGLADVPKPRLFKGARSTQEVENFLWGLEQNFKASGIMTDVDKVSTTSIYLADLTLLWWRHRCSDEKRGAHPWRLGLVFKRNSSNNSTPQMPKRRPDPSLGNSSKKGRSEIMCGSLASCNSKFPI